MKTKADLTQERIIQSAAQEFLEVGYQTASMRQIAAKAKVTTGAIYRYFADKETLFHAVTKDALAALEQVYTVMNDSALAEIEVGNTYDRNRSLINLNELFDIVYQHFDQFYLLVMYSEDTSSGSFVHHLAEAEMHSTTMYIEKMKAKYNLSYEVDLVGLQIVNESFISALLEPIRRRMPKAEAMKHIAFIGSYSADGWAGIEKLIVENKTE
ncbi:MAG: TetR/AcrR family transcriptional regulator [Lachnospiraceae bacterium]